jgi:hypothetical protein
MFQYWMRSVVETEYYSSFLSVFQTITQLTANTEAGYASFSLLRWRRLVLSTDRPHSHALAHRVTSWKGLETLLKQYYLLVNAGGMVDEQLELMPKTCAPSA